jgi:DNA-binding NarL/FixJ family response regulator
MKELRKTEQRLLQLTYEGLTNREIARSMGITERMVKAHVASIAKTWGIDQTKYHPKIRALYLWTHNT